MDEISAAESSRASTTRVNPSSFMASTPSRLCATSCVEAWSSSSGKFSRTIRATPRSCTMSASGPMSASSARASTADGSWSSSTTVLNVT